MSRAREIFLHNSNCGLRFRAVWIAIGWLLVALIAFLSLASAAVALPGDHGDKLGHGIAYFVLTLWFVQLYLSGKKRLLVVSACLALGIGLECAQMLTEARSFDIVDIAADAAGVMFGWMAAPPRGLAFLRLVEDAGWR